MQKKLLLVLPFLTLFSCGSVSTQNSLFQEGVVNNPTVKTNVKKLYNQALDTTEDLEDLNDVEQPSDDPTNVENPGEDVTNPENPGDVVENPPVEDTEEPTEEPVDNVITSYHVDYVIDYAFSASIEEHPIFTNSEKQIYSLTYVETEEEMFLKMDLAHEYLEDGYSGQQNIGVIYQKVDDKDYRLFVNQKIQNSYWGSSRTYEEKTSHRINPRSIYHEYDDYFISMAQNAMLDPTSRLENDSLMETLLTSENVEIIDVDENSVKIKFNYNDTETTMIFDTTLQTFTSITFDKSNEFQHILEENEKNENPFTIDEYRYTVSMNFTYNISTMEKLTEEEMKEYRSKDRDYSHYNDYYGRGDKEDYHHGYHGGHDPYHNDHDNHEEKDHSREDFRF